MNISIEFNIYHEHKLFYDYMAVAMQAKGHKVGIVSGRRVREVVDRGQVRDNLEIINKDIGFKPDFIHLWGESETISNGNLWKAYKLDDENISVHFDPDATELKKYTDRWILKVMDSNQKHKF